MRKQTALLAAVLLAACSAPQLPRSSRGEPVLEVRGAVKHGPFRLGRADLEALPRRTVRGRDPLSGRLATWEGPSLATLAIERVELTRGADVVVMRTADRRAVPIPLSLVRQLKPVLADRADGEALDAPVLAWPTEEQRGLDTDPRAHAWWTHGVVALELVNGYATLGRAVAVPPGAADGARLGADLFGARCLGCHRLRAAGGEAGPELTRVTERMTEETFRARLVGHPGWLERTPEQGEASAQHVWAFLRAVGNAARDGAAGDEPAPEEPARDRRPAAHHE
jgi:mono/diheme cytochrome c family protein